MIAVNMYILSMGFTMSTEENNLILILILVNIPVFFLLGKRMFKKWELFINAFFFWNKSNMSLFSSEPAIKDKGKAAYMPLFALLCVALVWVEFFVITKIIVFARHN
jgi:hypothetical protein